MMYPRLSLLKEFLREDGAIFVSIDDNEVATLRLLMDEIFGPANFVATVLWQKKYAVANDHKTIAPMHDFILVYQSSLKWKRNLLPRGEEKDEQYKYEDKKGIFRNSDYTCSKTAEERPNLFYAIRNPNTGEEVWPKRTRVWAYSQEEHAKNTVEDLIYWGKDGKGKVPAYKRYKHALRNANGVVPQTLWLHEFAGHTDGARKELREILHDVPSVSDFATPKPTRLIQRILQMATDKDSLVLDSFAGSGTTGHAVTQLNKEDDGSRRFILIEMDARICEKVTGERLRRICRGYEDAKGKKGEGLGAGYQYCKLGPTCFDELGKINKEVVFAELARHVFFSETGTPIPKQPKANSPLLGVYKETAVYLLYNGVLKDKKIDGGNVLTQEVLCILPKHDGSKVIYGTACRLSVARLKRENIIFRQIPYQIKVR